MPRGQERWSAKERARSATVGRWGGAEEDPAAVVLELDANPHRLRHEGGQSGGVVRKVSFSFSSFPSSGLFLPRNVATEGVRVGLTSVCSKCAIEARPNDGGLSQKRRTR
ncbi:hypothetical protein BHM03_00042065 [Ensete ventricosum]|nr:hypothetical protein BHM03_00042065 [Ensete ventricosum]